MKKPYLLEETKENIKRKVKHCIKTETLFQKLYNLNFTIYVYKKEEKKKRKIK